MQLRFQATPLNLNAQVDRNNNKLHKFKIYRTCSGACLGLTLGQCQLENNCSTSFYLRSCTSGSIHPSSRCVHHSPSSGSAPTSHPPCDSSIAPEWNATMHMYECKVPSCSTMQMLLFFLHDKVVVHIKLKSRKHLFHFLLTGQSFIEQ